MGVLDLTGKVFGISSREMAITTGITYMALIQIAVFGTEQITQFARYAPRDINISQMKPEDAQILNLKLPNDRLLHISAYYYLETDRYGTQLKEKYQSLKNSLRDTYPGHGSEKEIDHLALSSILDKPEDYMLSISTGERKLGYGVRLSPDNKWQLSAVGVVVHPDRINEETIEVLYAFQDWDEYFKSRNRKEALEF